MVAAVLVGAACSSDDGGSTAAASVNGVEIPASEVEADVAVLGADEATTSAFRGELAQLYRTATRVYPDSVEATALSVRVIDELVVQELAARDIVPSDFDREGAEQLLQDTYGSASATFDEGFRDRWVSAMANRIALSNALALERPPTDPTDAEIDVAYRRAVAGAAQQGDVACVTVVLVASAEPGQGEPTAEQVAAARAEADAAYVRLQGGEDIVRVALDISDDSSKDVGGDIGCVPVKADPATPFEEAVATQPVGEIAPPVPDEAGYYLVEVRSRGVVPLAELRSQLVETLERQRAQQFPGDLAPWLVDLASAAAIEVDPAWGVWDPDNATVVPPAGVGGG